MNRGERWMSGKCVQRMCTFRNVLFLVLALSLPAEAWIRLIDTNPRPILRAANCAATDAEGNTECGILYDIVMAVAGSR
jgi:hypothetical protein